MSELSKTIVFPVSIASLHFYQTNNELQYQNDRHAFIKNFVDEFVNDVFILSGTGMEIFHKDFSQHV